MSLNVLKKVNMVQGQQDGPLIISISRLNETDADK